MGQGLRALSGSLFRAHGDFGRTVMVVRAISPS